MKKIVALISLCGLLLNVQGQKPEETEDWSRKPEVVTPGKGSLPLRCHHSVWRSRRPG